jgi:polysaccharide export outer membrane protein
LFYTIVFMDLYRLFIVIVLLLFLGLSGHAQAASASNYNALQGLDYGSGMGDDPDQPDPAIPGASDDATLSAPAEKPAGNALPDVSVDDLKPRAYGTALNKDPAAELGGDKNNRTGNEAQNDKEDDVPSRIEQSYDNRLPVALPQFGYNLFNPSSGKQESSSRPGMPAGAVQDDFILSAGDRLDVTFRGQKSSRDTYTVDSKGQLLIPDLAPLTAAGRTIGDIRAALQADVSMTPNEQIFVTLDTVRQIDVLVVGHVAKPGRQTLTVFDTVLDALQDAGGIGKDGSLRRIMLVRGDGARTIDLYSLLLSGGAKMDLALRDGDRLVVPPVGQTVAVSGGVKRPGIYELGGNSHLNLKQMIGLAGGLLSPGQMRMMRLGLTADGHETVQEVTSPDASIFGNGDILSVEPAKPQRTGNVELAGDTRRPGLHALATAPTLSSLLDSRQVFGPDIYPLIGAVERQDKDQLNRQWIPFLPLQVVNHNADLRLQDGDIVHLFSRADILALQQPDRDLPAPAETKDADSLSNDSPDPLLAAWLKERSVYVRGAVRQPGAWPVAEGATLQSVLSAAGGLTLSASSEAIEVTTAVPNEDGRAIAGGQARHIIDLSRTDPASITLDPGDTVRVNPKARRLEENSVLLAGQVERPGRYDLLPGEHLSDLLKRAGGLTREAYPSGAIFSRESERKAEEQRFQAEARALEMGLAASLHDKGDKSPNPDQIAAVEQLVTQLKEAPGVGRITVEADPDALEADPAQDILLETGDRVFIPQRPLTVRVAGEVLSPSSLQFRKDKDARDYVLEAGGFTYNADEDRTFVLYPNGSAQPLHVGPWRHSAAFIPPGSTVVVPRDPKPFDFLETARDVTQILSNLAVTGIFIDDLHNNNN